MVAEYEYHKKFWDVANHIVDAVFWLTLAYLFGKFVLAFIRITKPC